MGSIRHTWLSTRTAVSLHPEDRLWQRSTGTPVLTQRLGCVVVGARKRVCSGTAHRLFLQFNFYASNLVPGHDPKRLAGKFVFPNMSVKFRTNTLRREGKVCWTFCQPHSAEIFLNRFFYAVKLLCHNCTCRRLCIFKNL